MVGVIAFKKRCMIAIKDQPLFHFGQRRGSEERPRPQNHFKAELERLESKVMCSYGL